MRKFIFLVSLIMIFSALMIGCSSKDSDIFNAIKNASQQQRENYVSIFEETGLSISFIEKIDKTDDKNYSILSSIYDPVTMSLNDDWNIEYISYHDLTLYEGKKVVNTIRKIEKKEDILPLFNSLNWITPQLAESYYNVLCGEENDELDTYAKRIEQIGEDSFYLYMNNYVDPCVVALSENMLIKDVTYHEKLLYKNGNFVTKFATISNEEYHAKLEAEESMSTPDSTETSKPTTTSNSSEMSQQAFLPKDVSDATINSIQTYNDYLKMYQLIIEDYFANYEAAIKGTILYDVDTFTELKKTQEETFKQQENIYSSMGSKKIVGKSTLVEFLISYRDSLKEAVNTIKNSLN